MKVHFKAFHLNDRPFKCDQCLSSFAYKHLLTRHSSAVHSGNRKSKKRKDAVKDVELLEALTGYNHPRTLGRIGCLVPGCVYRFNREYDRCRHLRSEHGHLLPELDSKFALNNSDISTNLEFDFNSYLLNSNQFEPASNFCIEKRKEMFGVISRTSDLKESEMDNLWDDVLSDDGQEYESPALLYKPSIQNAL